jgi:hypothetical protein
MTRPECELALIKNRLLHLLAVHESYQQSATLFAIERCEAIAIEIAELERRQADLTALIARGEIGTRPLTTEAK